MVVLREGTCSSKSDFILSDKEIVVVVGALFDDTIFGQLQCLFC